MKSGGFQAFLAGALLVTAFAGCLIGDARTTDYHAFGSKGSYVAGWAYDGKGIVPFDGPVFVDVNDQDNVGTVIAKGKVGGRNFQVLFENFAQSRPFHDGGIAADFREHGASGTGDKSVPEVDLEMAGWGTALVTYGETPLKDPITGKDEWAAHFMVIRNGVRDNATGAIHADANKTKPYDPLHPENGTSVPGDYELHLVLRNQTGNASGPQTISRVMANTPNAALNANHNLFQSNTLGATAYVYVNLTSTAASVSNITLSFKGPGGTELVRRGLGPSAMGPPSQQTRFSAQFAIPVSELGQFSVAVTGRLGPGASYEITGLVVPPPTVVLNFWWEDLIFGLEAEERAEQEGLLEGTTAHMDNGHPPPSGSMSASATTSGSPSPTVTTGTGSASPTTTVRPTQR